MAIPKPLCSYAPMLLSSWAPMLLSSWAPMLPQTFDLQTFDFSTFDSFYLFFFLGSFSFFLGSFKMFLLSFVFQSDLGLLLSLSTVVHQRCVVGQERMRVSPKDRANSEPRSVATWRRQEEGDALNDKVIYTPQNGNTCSKFAVKKSLSSRKLSLQYWWTNAKIVEWGIS